VGYKPQGWSASLALNFLPTTLAPRPNAVRPYTGPEPRIHNPKFRIPNRQPPAPNPAPRGEYLFDGFPELGYNTGKGGQWVNLM